MKTITIETKIKASAAKVWQVLWTDSTYRRWTSAFQEGSYAVSDWKEGSKVHFLSPSGEGMFSIIAECRPNEHMAFRHLGVIKKFEEQPETDETKKWSGSMETYTLKEDNGITSLVITMDSIDEFLDYFNKTFPAALKLVTELAENPVILTVQTEVAAPVEKVWKFWTDPVHITKWNNASADWHTPFAENDLRDGGKFLSRMEAKDGSFGFDFWGVYDKVVPNRMIAFTMGDGRKVKIDFTAGDGRCKITEAFEAEEQNSLELQQNGWQAIMNNFKKYTELNLNN